MRRGLIRTCLRGAALLSFAFLACSRPPRQPEGLLLAREEILRRAPDHVDASKRVWLLDRSSDLGVSYTELHSLEPLEIHDYVVVSIFVLSGRLKLRVGASERVLGPGGYARIPPLTPYRLVRVGPENALYVSVVFPNIEEDAISLEQPAS